MTNKNDFNVNKIVVHAETPKGEVYIAPIPINELVDDAIFYMNFTNCNIEIHKRSCND